MAIRLVLADDHPLILDGLVDLFAPEADISILARCRTGPEALEAVRKHRPDVLVLDFRMPGLAPMELLRAIAQAQVPSVVALYTAALNKTEMLEAVRLGVRGVVLKEMPPRLLVECIRAVHAGQYWLEKNVTTQALETMLRHQDSSRDVMGLLTPRELEIVRLVARGARNKSIAEALAISEGTVKIHLHNIYKKLPIDSRLALTLYAREKGLV